MATSLLLVIIAIIVLVLYLYKFSKQRPENFPPGPPRLPLWGSYWFMLRENYDHMHLAFMKLARKHKTDILGLYLGDTPTVVTLSHELSKELLTREEFIGRNDTILVRERALGELKGIFFVDGPFWKEERRFTLRQMRDFGFGRRSEAVEDFVKGEVNNLIELLNSGPTADNSDICRGQGEVSMPDALYGPLFNSILMILTSTRFDNRQLREYARAALRFQRSGDATGSAITMTPWLRFIAPDFFGFTAAVENNKLLLDFLWESIMEHVKTFSDDHHRDFIDVYLSQRLEDAADTGLEDVSNVEKRDYKQLLLILLDCMFPAAIAVGHTLNFLFAHLINHQEVQMKIQQEIDQVVGWARLPDLDDRKSMPYLEASIRESTRILPLNPLGVARRCMKDTIFAGYFIPKDTIMLPNVWTAHNDERVWEKPDEFLPERFLDSDGNLLKKDLTIGFGAGKRLCAGETFARQNIFLIVAGILQNFTLKSPTGKKIKMDLVPGMNLSLKENWVLAVPR